MKRLEILGIVLAVVVLLGTPAAVFAGQRYLNAPVHTYTIVANTVEDGGYVPDQITVVQGEHVRLRLTSGDVSHGLYQPELGINVTDIYPGKFTTVDFTPAKPGTYRFICTVMCSPSHFMMHGEIVVVPADQAKSAGGTSAPGLQVFHDTMSANSTENSAHGKLAQAR